MIIIIITIIILFFSSRKTKWWGEERLWCSLATLHRRRSKKTRSRGKSAERTTGKRIAEKVGDSCQTSPHENGRHPLESETNKCLKRNIGRPPRSWKRTTKTGSAFQAKKRSTSSKNVQQGNKETSEFKRRTLGRCGCALGKGSRWRGCTSETRNKSAPRCATGPTVEKEPFGLAPTCPLPRVAKTTRCAPRDFFWILPLLFVCVDKLIGREAASRGLWCVYEAIAKNVSSFFLPSRRRWTKNRDFVPGSRHGKTSGRKIGTTPTYFSP